MSTTRGWARLALAALLLVTAGCGGDPAPPSPPPGTLLVADGVTIAIAEVERFFPYVDAVEPRTGRNTRIMGILDNHTLPLAFARVDFAGPRRAARTLAEDLRAAIGNDGYPGLVARSRGLPGTLGPRHLARSDVPMVVAAYLFDDANIGQVSPVLEAPDGFWIASAFERVDRGASTLDVVEAVTVAFRAPDTATLAAWWPRRREEVASALTYVHPDYLDALPRWLRPR